MRFSSAVVAVLAASTLLLSACARNMDGSTVTSSSSVGKVLYGRVVSARAVTIKDSEQLQDNVLGGAAGGIAGGVAASSIGKGNGQNVATVGGAIAGAVLGALIQDQLGTSSGYEYIVKLDSSQKAATKIKKSKKDITLRGQDMVEDDVMSSAEMASMESETISVIQQDAQAIPMGSKVMVVYRDDRAHLTLAQ